MQHIQKIRLALHDPTQENWEFIDYIQKGYRIRHIETDQIFFVQSRCYNPISQKSTDVDPYWDIFHETEDYIGKILHCSTKKIETGFLQDLSRIKKHDRMMRFYCAAAVLYELLQQKHIPIQNVFLDFSLANHSRLNVLSCDGKVLTTLNPSIQKEMLDHLESTILWNHRRIMISEESYTAFDFQTMSTHQIIEMLEKYQENQHAIHA